jgi:SAM-dependent methyltransferase
MLEVLRSRLRRGESSSAAARFFVKSDYVVRDRPDYLQDELAEKAGVVHQPDVYPFAAHLARLFECRHVIDVGCGRAHKLAELHPEFEPVGIDFGDNIQHCRVVYPFGRWIDWNLEQSGSIPLPPEVVPGSVVVCADVIEHLADPTNLLRNLRDLLEHAPVALLSTPERDLVRGVDHHGPPDNPHHVREWSLAELEQLVHAAGLRLAFSGLTASEDQTFAKQTSLLVLEGRRVPKRRPAPDGFRATALMCVHNEADVIEGTIRHLIDEGLDLYLLDNWSTDGTREVVERYVGRGVVGIEPYPREGPADQFEWAGALARFEDLARELPSDWFVHVDADERRRTPWAGVSLLDGVYHADRCGFNCVDHTTVVFHPTDGSFAPENDPEDCFRAFDFGQFSAHFLQVKAWKNLSVAVERASTGGHDTRFEGRRVYPYKFLLKHYPIRSQRHGARKVFGERLGRWSAEKRANGWHIHYDHLSTSHVFLRDPAELDRFEPADFDRRFLVERLSGIGIPRLAGAP